MTKVSKELQKFIAQQTEYVFNPVKWAYDNLKFDCDRWQREALEDLVKKRFCAWSTGTGVGKSANLSIATLWFLSTRPFPKVPSTAPSQHQLYDVLWSEHAKWMRRSELLSKMFKWTQTRIGLRGHEEEWFAVARTSRPKPGEQHAEGLQGFHSGHILFVIDEGSAVDDTIYSAMDGAFTTPDSYGIIASNPTRRSGYFFRQISDPQRSSYAIKFVDANNCRMVAKESIARVIQKYGLDSDFYRVKVLGLPPLIDFASLFSAEQVAEMHGRDFDPADTDPTIVSCDPARFGDDYTIVFTRKGMKVIDRMQLKGMDTMQVADIVLTQLLTHNAKTVVVDVIGIGSGVVDRLKEEIRKRKLDVVVLEVNVAEVATDEVQFANKRAEMFWNLRSLFRDIALPLDTPLLDEELVSIKYSAEKKILIEKKEELKRVIGRSPNDADSLALLFYSTILRNEVKVSPTFFKIGSAASPRGAAHSQSLEAEQALARQGFQTTAERKVGGSRYSVFHQSDGFSNGETRGYCAGGSRFKM